MTRFFSNQQSPQIVSDPATTLQSADISSAELDTRTLSGKPNSATVRISEPISRYEAFVSPTDTNRRGQQTHSRYDAVTGRWTIFAVGRDDRPTDFVNVTAGEDTSLACPFCSGNEHQTPDAVLEISASECDSPMSPTCDCQPTAGESKPWVIRVIPNKFPAVDSPAEFAAQTVEGQAWSRRDDHPHSLFRSRPINGGHEVFIESPDHHQSIVTLDLSQATMLFRAYQMRMRYWRNVPSIKYISLFKNVGPTAGASLHHSHSQLIATSELPLAAKAVADRMKLHWAKSGCCLKCDIVRAEIKAKERVVATTNSLIAYCPFGSHLPMLLRITTRRHLECFEDLKAGELEELARLVRRSIRWLQAIYPEVAYNYLIKTRPPGLVGEGTSHWCLEIFPRVTQIAGFEWSSECMINPVLPEVAAAKYRELAMSENPLR